MLIGIERKFIFVANLKTASTAVEAVLAPTAEIRAVRTEWGKHMPLAAIETNFAWLFETLPLSRFTVFGVVREPVDWLVSLYRSIAVERFPLLPMRAPRTMSFTRFLDDWCPRNAWQCLPQSQRLRNASGRLAADVVIPYEHLQPRLDRLCRDLGLVGQPLRRLNTSPAAVPPPVLTPAQERHIRSFYAEDYRLLDAARQAVGRLSPEPPPPPLLLSREQVVWGYRLILGREPESEQVIDQHRTIPSLEALRQVLFASAEFRASRSA